MEGGNLLAGLDLDGPHGRRLESVGVQALLELGPHRPSLEDEVVAAARHAAAEDQVVEGVGELPVHAAPDLSAPRRGLSSERSTVR